MGHGAIGAIALFCILINSPAFAASIGGHSTYQAVPLKGDVMVRCQGPQGVELKHFYCHDYILEPYEYAYFQTDPLPGAEDVQIESHQPDGQTVRKKSPFNGETGQGTRALNLWIETLLQRPLLSEGINQISYRLLDGGGQTKAEGQFQISVEQLPTRYCPSGSELGQSQQDCQYSSRICRVYFAHRDWCREP
jgi:hypothetical protein